MPLYNVSRPVRLTAAGEAYGAQVVMTDYEISSPIGDVIVNFRNGTPNGEILWTAESDSAVGSKSHSFTKGILFTKGIYVEIVDNPGFLYSVCVALDLPQSAGTS